MTLSDYMRLTGPPPSAQIRYGDAPSQYVEFFQPAGSGPYPVVVLVHGGCWIKEYGGITQMRDMAGALAAEGIAVWSIEYRRVDEAGGGYPGTYLDIAAGFASLLKQAPARHLDMDRMVAVGHSAGGHLVQWFAGRNRIPTSSPLHDAHPFALRQVIALGSISDLQRRQDGGSQVCGVDIAKIAGVPKAARPDIYADTSPAELLPSGSHTVLINGAFDSVSPPETATEFAGRARAAGDNIETLVLPDASHYDEVASASPAWKLIMPVIRKALATP